MNTHNLKRKGSENKVEDTFNEILCKSTEMCLDRTQQQNKNMLN